MFVTELSLTDFRNYETAALELTDGVTVFVGSNGQGKTNLVEAVEYLSTMSSHRVSSTAPLIRAGAESAVLRARVQAGRDDPRHRGGVVGAGLLDGLQVVEHRRIHAGVGHAGHLLGALEEAPRPGAGLRVAVPVEAFGEGQALGGLEAQRMHVVDEQHDRHQALA